MVLPSQTTGPSPFNLSSTSQTSDSITHDNQAQAKNTPETKTDEEPHAVEKTDLQARRQYLDQRGLQPGYTRRLIKRIYMDPQQAALDPDLIGDVSESTWNLKLYGPKIKVVATRGVPSGWVLVDRMSYY